MRGLETSIAGLRREEKNILASGNDARADRIRKQLRQPRTAGEDEAVRAQRFHRLFRLMASSDARSERGGSTANWRKMPPAFTNSPTRDCTLRRAIRAPMVGCIHADGDAVEVDLRPAPRQFGRSDLFNRNAQRPLNRDAVVDLLAVLRIEIERTDLVKDRAVVPLRQCMPLSRAIPTPSGCRAGRRHIPFGSGASLRPKTRANAPRPTHRAAAPCGPCVAGSRQSRHRTHLRRPQ